MHFSVTSGCVSRAGGTAVEQGFARSRSLQHATAVLSFPQLKGGVCGRLLSRIFAEMGDGGFCDPGVVRAEEMQNS
jgi:hypothetical protein